MINQVVLSACIAEIKAMRYTPAGVPAFNFSIEHESQLMEAGQERQVKATVKAVAFGALAEALCKQPVGSLWKFAGFLATPRSGRHAVLHVQSFEKE